MERLVVFGGAICTMDAADTFIKEGSIAIKDGSITQIAEGRLSASNVLDTSNCVILPGLVNAHSHVFLTMLRGLSDDERLEPWLDRLSPAIAAMTEEDMRRSTAMGCREALRTGTTCICECCRYAPQYMAEEASRIGLRCIVGGMPASEWFDKPLPTDVPGLVEKTREIKDHPDKFHGLVTTYIGAHSPYNCSPDFLRELKQHARNLGGKFNIHLAETRTEIETIRARHGKTPVRFLHDLGLLDEQTIANHCVWLTDEDIEIFKASKAGMVHCPVSNAKLASGVAPITQYLQHQIPIGLGTDSVVSNNGLNMFDEMRTSVLLQRVVTDTFAYTAKDALRLATIGSARVLGLDEQIGSIEPGKRADLLLLRLPPEMDRTYASVVSHIVYSADVRDLLAVIVDGRIVAREGKLVSADEETQRADDHAYFEQKRVARIG